MEWKESSEQVEICTSSIEPKTIFLVMKFDGRKILNFMIINIFCMFINIFESLPLVSSDVLLKQLCLSAFLIGIESHCFLFKNPWMIVKDLAMNICSPLNYFMVLTWISSSMCIILAVLSLLEVCTDITTFHMYLWGKEPPTKGQHCSIPMSFRSDIMPHLFFQ